jgi:isocitrate dehydrogenase kinase/phosphatase
MMEIDTPMEDSDSDTSVDAGAELILEAFDRYQSRFNTITSRAARRFANRDWPGMQADTVERLDLYPAVVSQYVQKLSQTLAHHQKNDRPWANVRQNFSLKIASRNDRELAETFFNSLVRKLLNTIGADPVTTFVHPDFERTKSSSDPPIFKTYKYQGDATELVTQILATYPLEIPFENLAADAAAVAQKIDDAPSLTGEHRPVEHIDMIPEVFYRGMGAYLVGRMHCGDSIVPLVLSLLNRENGIVVDAVLTEEETVTVLFSFTRAYFHVAVERPSDLVAFIRTLLPRKRIDEIYTTLGYNKHGKTELYRELVRHLSVCCQDRFDFSRGKHGMVMIVFNMPSDDLVFKVIREKIAPPKQTNRADVMAKYDLVFHHDRAGRLIDAQSFDNLSFNDCCFTAPLTEEMQRDAPETIRHEENAVIIEQLYVERRVIPLDIYIREANPEDAAAAVIDFGRAIKDLAVSNIFPGDMLLKNFGVTSRNRVVFYDYDELMPVTECVFRNIPKSRSYEDEMREEPWYFVGENDVFPEELERFLGLPDDLRSLFMKHHADLFQAEYWQAIQARLQANEPIHIFPYGPEHRIRFGVQGSPFRVQG